MSILRKQALMLAASLSASNRPGTPSSWVQNSVNSSLLSKTYETNMFTDIFMRWSSLSFSSSSSGAFLHSFRIRRTATSEP